jgi:hypothetical protein
LVATVGLPQAFGIYQPRNQQNAASDQNERYQSFRHGTLRVHCTKKKERWAGDIKAQE